MSPFHAAVLRRTGLLACGVITVVVTGVVLAAVYGVTAEYGGGAFGSLVVPTLVCLTPVVAVLALWRTSARRRIMALVLLTLLVAIAVGGAAWVGERANRDRADGRGAPAATAASADDAGRASRAC